DGMRPPPKRRERGALLLLGSLRRRRGKESLEARSTRVELFERISVRLRLVELREESVDLFLGHRSPLPLDLLRRLFDRNDRRSGFSMAQDDDALAVVLRAIDDLRQVRLDLDEGRLPHR